MTEFKNRIVGEALVPPESLTANPDNWRTHPEHQTDALRGVMTEVGIVQRIIVNQRTGNIVDGHARVEIAIAQGQKEIPVLYVDLSHDEELLVLATLDPIGALAGTDVDHLRDLLDSVSTEDPALQALLDQLREQASDAENEASGSLESESRSGAMSNQFLIPPFSILNAREGWWQKRKKSWLSLGIRSEEGRGSSAGEGTGYQVINNWAKKHNIRDKIVKSDENANGGGASVFDPVLVEIALRWFSPVGGTVLDPFAGGSVRGVVAAKLGRQYIGHELRPEQVEANRQQWNEIDQSVIVVGEPVLQDDFMPELTPIEEHEGILVKRDDMFTIGGVSGGKVRTCWHLAQGAEGLVTAGSRQSPQVNIVAQIAKRLGIPCHAHTPEGVLSPEVKMAKDAGAKIIQHKAGYNNVIIARAREDADALGWTDIPFGMECEEAINQTRLQVRNIPKSVKRIVMPVGSGMSLAGVLHGLKDCKLKIPVVGVRVGADPVPRLDEYAPKGWRDMVTLVDSGIDYHTPAPQQHLGTIKLDPIYEAKCLPFLTDGDLFWIVGIRASETMVQTPVELLEPVWVIGDSRTIDKTCHDVQADMIFTCPPYADLEVYSDDPLDISTLDYDQFREVYFEIIAKSCALLKPDRFACIVVGEVRCKGEGGGYRNFVGDTIKAFVDAGLTYYNEAILITPVGSLPMRAGRQFSSSRQLGKTHQNILVFVKGDPKAATLACGDIDVSESLDLIDEGDMVDDGNDSQPE